MSEDDDSDSLQALLQRQAQELALRGVDKLQRQRTKCWMDTPARVVALLD